MDHDLKHIVAYIQEHRQRGIHDQHIASHMRQHGWTDKWLIKAFTAANTPESGRPQPAPQPVASASPQPTNLPAPTQKYKVFRSLADAFKAAKRNPLTVLGSVISAFVVITVGGTLIAFVLVPGSAHHNVLATMLLLILMFIFSIIVSAALISAFSIALASSAHNEKLSIKQVLDRTVAVVPRVVLANLLSCLIIAGPLIVVACTAITMVARQQFSAGAGLLTGLLGLASAVWILIAELRFALVPYVAIFEPHTPIAKSLSRSNFLMQKGGQWFVVKGFLLILVIGALLSAVSDTAFGRIGQSSNVFVVIMDGLVSIVDYGALVMLYLNRAAVRGASNQQSSQPVANPQQWDYNANQNN